MATASHEAPVPPQEITLRLPRYGAEATIKAGKQFGLVLLLDGKVLNIPAVEIKGIDDIHTKDAFFLTPMGHGGEVPEDQFRTVGFIFSFAYGGRYDHGKKGEELSVYKRCRLHFGPDGTFERFETLTPLGDLKNQWQIWVKPLGREGYDNGIIDSVESPLQ